jgi:hypothetical protein
MRPCLIDLSAAVTQLSPQLLSRAGPRWEHDPCPERFCAALASSDSASSALLLDPSQLVQQLPFNYWGLQRPRTPLRQLVPQLVQLQLLRHSTCLLSHVPLSSVLVAEQTNKKHSNAAALRDR